MGPSVFTPSSLVCGRTRSPDADVQCICSALIVFNNTRGFNNWKGSLVFLKRRMEGCSVLALLLLLCDAWVCLRGGNTPFLLPSSSLSLSPYLVSLSPTHCSPTPPPPLPTGNAELISADAVVTEAGCEIRSPGVAAQQGCQFPWLIVRERKVVCSHVRLCVYICGWVCTPIWIRMGLLYCSPFIHLIKC